MYDVDIIYARYLDRDAKARCLVMTCVSNGLPNNRNYFICRLPMFALRCVHIFELKQRLKMFSDEIYSYF